MCKYDHDSRKKVSIVILCHNSESTLRRCLKSITSQSHQNMEIICIDDCSEDNTTDIIREYAEKDDRIVCMLNEKWKGIMKSRIEGIDRASGEYICFVDSDDEICNNYIESLLQNILENRANVVYSKIRVVGPDETKDLRPPFEGRNAKGDVKKQFIESHGEDYQWYVVWGKMYHKNILKSILPKLSELDRIQMCEDLIINSAAMEYLNCASLCEQTKYFYHININSGITSSSSTVLKNMKYIHDVKKTLMFLSNTMNLSRRDEELWKKHFNKIYIQRIELHPYNIITKKYLKIYLYCVLNLRFV